MSIRRFAFCLALALTALVVSACGGTVPYVAPSTNKPVSSHEIAVPVKTACPPGGGTMGCSVQPSPLAAAADVANASRPSGPIFPDVSSYQGHPNWVLAKPHIWGAVAKLGEYVLDPDAQYNVGQFRALHIRWSVYLFVRPQGCTTESNLALAWLKQIGGPSTSGPVLVLDEEEPGLSGYATCIDSHVFAVYHRHVVIYTAPGTWSGGPGVGDGWLAAYGPSSPPGCPWGCHPSAWQFTDGQYGFPTYIPGIGTGDVSIAYHFFQAVKPPKPQGPACFGKGWKHGSACNKVRAEALHLGAHVKQERGYAKVSQHNLAVIQARLARELKKAGAYEAELQKLLGKYHYHPNHH